MYLLVGLQNPGETYEYTRHNAGGIAVRAFVDAYELPALTPSAKFSGDVSEGAVDGREIRVLLPTTFMNHSGTAVKKACADVQRSGDLIVVYDDLDLPIGGFKISHGRGSGGHNGVESVASSLGSRDFVRVRIGISPVSFFGNLKRPAGEYAAKYVLQDFSKRERAKLDAILPDVARAIHTIITEGKEKAMNEFN